jgi:hypothetical protein
MIAIAKRKNPCARWEYFKASRAAGNAIRSPVNEEEGFAQSKGVSKSHSIIKRPLALERYRQSSITSSYPNAFCVYFTTRIFCTRIFEFRAVFFLFFFFQKGIFEHLE